MKAVGLAALLVLCSQIMHVQGVSRISISGTARHPQQQPDTDQQHYFVDSIYSGAQGRRLQATFPDSSTNVATGQANPPLVWPAAAFQAACLADATCSSVQGDVGPVLDIFMINMEFSATFVWSQALLRQAAALNLAMKNDLSVTNLRPVSSLATLSVAPSTAGRGLGPICNSSAPCEASITFVLNNINATDVTLCIRLVKDGNSVSMEGYPAGAGPTGLSAGPVTNARVICSTTMLGWHAVAQFTRVPLLPPPSPPPPPLPPPIANPTGAADVPVGAASIAFQIGYNLDYSTLQDTSSPLLEDLKADTTRHAAQNLAAAFPALFSSTSTTLPLYDRVSVTSIMPGSILVNYKAALPEGTDQSQIDAVLPFFANTDALIRDSQFADEATSSKVLSVNGMEDSHGLKLWEILAIVAGSITGLVLLLLLLVCCLRRYARAAVLPSDQDTVPPIKTSMKPKKQRKVFPTNDKEEERQLPFSAHRAPPPTAASLKMEAWQAPSEMATQPSFQPHQQQQQEQLTHDAISLIQQQAHMQQNQLAFMQQQQASLLTMVADPTAADHQTRSILQQQAQLMFTQSQAQQALAHQQAQVQQEQQWQQQQKNMSALPGSTQMPWPTTNTYSTGT